jgi:predicted Zn-dependent protease with MMP-like domain
MAVPRDGGGSSSIVSDGGAVDNVQRRPQHGSMKRMSLRKFGRIVAGVMQTLPEEIARCLDNVVVDVEEEPTDDDLRAAGFTEEEIEAGETLYGLFSPLPLPQPDEVNFLDEPHRIFIYKRPLEEDFPDPRQLQIEIRKTVVHEVAHHFGLTDRDLERFDDNPDPFEGRSLDNDST